MKIISTRKYDARRVRCNQVPLEHLELFTLGKEYSIMIHGFESNNKEMSYIMIESDNGQGVMFREASYQDVFALVE